jgi:N-acetylglucosaminyldiphosphoundecaprenol N-acetyl-beta-D-mannosaminyltransferase
MIQRRTVDILGLPVHVLTPSGFVELVEESIQERAGKTFVSVNAHSLSLAGEDPDYSELLREADVLYADGASIVFASCFLGTPLPAKLTTTDLWPLCCDLACKKGYRMYLLGGEPGLAREAAEITMRTRPEIQFAGAHHGYFAPDDEEVIRAINGTRSDILWVGMGDPLQVRWAQRKKTLLDAGAIITCGGMFRLITGRQRRPGPLLHRTGFEWLGRIFHEPGVWKRYLRDLPPLGARIFLELFSGRRTR